jgi:hypothetical protein
MARRKTYGFSMKRLLGVTNVKRKVAKATGIPTTKQGRRNKARRILTGGGCLVPIMIPILVFTAAIALIVSLI